MAKNALRCGLFFLLLALTINPKALMAQTDKESDWVLLHKMEDSLVRSADSMFYTPIPDFRTEYCEKFVKQLIRTLKIPGSYKYPFDSLGKIVNIIYPEDKSFKIFNWPIAYTDVRLRYYAAIQMNEENLKLYPLYDNSELLTKIDEDKILGAKEWIGGLIYNIITKKIEDENIYCLLGINDGNPISTKKFIDPMRFTKDGPSFGAPLFAIGSTKNPSQGVNRFILEYKKEVSVGMNWDEEHKAILFDDIASQVNDPNRKYTFIPTGQYNGLIWGKGQWKFVANLIPVKELKDGEAPAGEK
ncbi:MAG: hypothetical protein QM530_10835 [Phycisphaerales bacterium]|nr:hypothetical protein [Phycisphaerales bacterium]